MSQWEKTQIQINLPSDLSKLMEVYTSIADPTKSFLDTISTVLNTAKTFLLDDINPLLAAMIFIADQMIDFVESIRNSGVYVISLYPNQDMNTRFVKYRDVLPGFDEGDTSGFHILDTNTIINKFLESFDDKGDNNRPPSSSTLYAGGLVIFGGAVSRAAMKTGSVVEDMFTLFITLSGLFRDLFNQPTFGELYDSLYKKRADIIAAREEHRDGVAQISRITINNVSLNNTYFHLHDAAREDETQKDYYFWYNVNGGGTDPLTGGFGIEIPIATGALTSEVANITRDKINLLTQTGDFKAITEITDFSTSVVVTSLKVGEMENPKDARNTAQKTNFSFSIIKNGSNASTFEVKVNKSVIPDWKTQKLVRDVVPPLGGVLDSIEGFAQGIKDQAIGSQGTIQGLIDFIDVKLAEIKEIKTQIDAFYTYLNLLSDAINELGEFEFATLTVNPQVGGINILKQQIADKSLTDRPDEDLQYCAIMGFVGSGTGFSLLLYLLGLSNNIEWGIEDNVNFTDDEVKNKHRI